MVKHGLLVCSFSLKNRHSRGKEEDFLDLNGEYEYAGEKYNGFLDMFKTFVDAHKNLKENDDIMKVFGIQEESVEIEEDTACTVITCIVESGSYGMEGSIKDVKTKKLNYERKITDADDKFFQFMIYIPKGATEDKIIKGILLFEMIGAYGVKSITVTNMRDYFSNQFNLSLETRSVSTSGLIEKLVTEEKLYKMTVIKNNISGDDADNMFVTVGREERSYIRPKMTENLIQKLLAVIDKKDVDRVYEVVEDVDVEDIRFEFNYMGRTRTARLSAIDKFSMIEDIPDSIYSGNKTNYDALKRFMKRTACEYGDKMVFVFEE